MAFLIKKKISYSYFINLIVFFLFYFGFFKCICNLILHTWSINPALHITYSLIPCYSSIGEKPHKCKICGRGFKQLTHLTYHLRTHSETKMYSCDICGKGFNQKGNLQAHIYGHTGMSYFHHQLHSYSSS